MSKKKGVRRFRPSRRRNSGQRRTAHGKRNRSKRQRGQGDWTRRNSVMARLRRDSQTKDDFYEDDF